jgi:formamidopyrimidine-DNA glycosylase
MVKISPMPELPELEVAREYLSQRVVDLTITSAEVCRPVVVRNLLGGDLPHHMVGGRFTNVDRRGKFLLFPMNGVPHAEALWLVIHPMMVGRLRYGEPLKRHRKRDALVLRLADGQELLYNDTRDMGKVYLTDDVDRIPGFANLGPEATDPALTLEIFRQRIRRHYREIKSVLSTQTFVAGIGSAYADEICWRAGIYPYRRRADLNADEVARLYEEMQAVLSDAVDILAERMEELPPGPVTVPIKNRDSLAVHGKGGRPCPRCGSAISKVTRERRPTNFCRTCQPGLLVGGGRKPQTR